MPRRVRGELELERPDDLRYRTNLTVDLEPGETRLPVRDGRRLPSSGSFIRIGDEWMEILDVSGDAATVRRARRGTIERAHGKGSVVHHGKRLIRELPLSGRREEWLR